MTVTYFITMVFCWEIGPLFQALYLESRHGINVKVLELVDKWYQSVGNGQNSQVKLSHSLYCINYCFTTQDTECHCALCVDVGSQLAYRSHIDVAVFLQCLSLNYCQIGESGGQFLGMAIVSTSE